MILLLVAAVALMASACGSTTTADQSQSKKGGGILGDLLGGLASENTVNSLANLVIGSVKLDQKDLIGTWQYKAPACAFTSENLLAKAGGAVAAGEVNEKLQTVYGQGGINASNTSLTFKDDGTFNGQIKGIPLSGTYTFDSSRSAVKLKMLLMSSTAYVTRTTNGLSFTFESKKLLSALQTMAKLTGNSAIETVGNLSKEYDGVRVGFDMKKK